MLSALLALAGLALAITALFVGPQWLPWLALGLCLLGGVPYLLPFVLKQVARRGMSESEPESEPESEFEPELGPELGPEADPAMESGASVKKSTGSANGKAEDGAELVAVLPGRRRYHRPDCELVVDGNPEVMTLADALDEEFTACSRCGGN